MDSYFTKETLGYHPCSNCRLVGGTDRKLSIINAPQLLVIQLGRFTNQFSKTESFVGFTTELGSEHIRDGNGQQMIYRLTGLIAHVGPSIAAGHYISYFASNGKWYEANDSLVTEIDWEIVRKLQAYLFFYQQLQ